MKRLLLVDDDVELSELLARKLSRAGYEVRSADSLRAALELTAVEAPFDVLITDFHLPDADGAGVAAALRVPITLGLTGSSDPADAERLRAAGFAAVLIKPVGGQQVLDAVARTLGEPA